MKFPRFLGGFTAGAGLCYLLSPVHLKVSTRPNIKKFEGVYQKFDEQINEVAEYFPEWREIRSLREQSKKNDIEHRRLTSAYHQKIDKQDAEYDRFDKKTKTIRKLEALLKRDLDHQDNEIKWLKKQLGEEDQLQGEEP